MQLMSFEIFRSNKQNMIQLSLCELQGRKYRNDTEGGCIYKVKIEKDLALNLALCMPKLALLEKS